MAPVLDPQQQQIMMQLWAQQQQQQQLQQLQQQQKQQEFLNAQHLQQQQNEGNRLKAMLMGQTSGLPVKPEDVKIEDVTMSADELNSKNYCTKTGVGGS